MFTLGALCLSKHHHHEGNRVNNALNHSSSLMTLHDEVDVDIDMMIAKGKNT
jgi:hypothetical protein